MKNKILISLLVTLVILESVFSAPLPCGIAIKKDTKECAGFWPGDEFFSNKLPAGWEAYFPDNDKVITTEFGNCSNFMKWVSDPPGAEEKCCKELGLTFISENIGESHGIWQLFIPPTIYWIILVLVSIVLTVAFFIALYLVIKRILKRLKKLIMRR